MSWVKEHKGRGGRPRKEINWDQVDALCEIQCTAKEIADVIGCNTKTLDLHTREIHGIRFREYMRQKSSGGKASLRRRQFNAAMDGNSTMMIWLGKNWLNQSDKTPEELVAEQQPIRIEVVGVKAGES